MKILIVTFTLLASQALADHLIAESSYSLYVVPPSRPLRYESPRDLLMSLRNAHKNTVSSSSSVRSAPLFEVGHVMVEVFCEASENRDLFHQFYALTDAHSKEQDIKLEIEQVAFGLAFEGTEGAVESSEAVYKKLSRLFARKARLAMMRFLVSESQCHEIVDDMQSFIHRGIHKTFALAADPLKNEGAGCSSFALTFLRSKNLIPESWLKSWERTLLVPDEIIGGQLTGREISIEDLSKIPQIRRWASEDEPHRRLQFYDPDLMYDWIQKLLDSPIEKVPKKIERDGPFESWYRKHFHPQVLSVLPD